MNPLQRIASMLQYIWHSIDAYGIDSPFVLQLYNEVIAEKTGFYIFRELELQKLALRKDKRIVHVTDYGSKSKGGLPINIKTTVAKVAKRSLSSTRKSQLLFRLANYWKPNHILELGTSLGISTLYLKNGHESADVLSFEGCPEIAEIARQNFQRFEADIRVEVGPLDKTLPKALQLLNEPLGMVFIDANHTYEATLRYFEWCLEKASEDTLFVIDDIHWSRPMEAVWKTIRQNPAVRVSIDLYTLGVIILRKKQPKQHFVLRF